MADKNVGEGLRGRRAEPEYTRDVDRWRASIADRDRIYAVSYRQAVDSGRSPEEARAIAREVFLKSFDELPETLFVVNLEKNFEE